MKKVMLFITLVLLVSCNVDAPLLVETNETQKIDGMSVYAADTNTSYYYYQGQKKMIEFDPQYVYVSSGDFNSISKSVSYAEPAVVQKETPSNDKFTENLKFEKVSAASNYANPRISGKPIAYVSPSIKGLGKDDSYLLPEFYVQVKEQADTVLLKRKAEQYGLNVVGEIPYLANWYKISCPAQNTIDALKYSNIFYESNSFVTSTPAFASILHSTVADPYFQYQWGLKNTGQYGGIVNMDIDIENAWSLATGYPTKVAVIDTGIDYSHPDINNGLVSYDAYTNEEHNMSCIIYNKMAHGTCCAGIIGAKNNSVGVVGVAHSAEIIGVTVPFDTYFVTPEVIARAFAWAYKNGAQVINCSWECKEQSDIIDAAINEAATKGRNHKGTVIMFASGNDNTSPSYPSTLSTVFCVGAMDMNGKRKMPSAWGSTWGSNYGECLDVVAPGVAITTTDITGSIGYSPNGKSPENINTPFFSDGNYVSFFNGTSAATPFVSGVAALMLAKNNNLTNLEVYKIIRETCTKLPTYNYTSKTYGSWNNEVGYGLVNAFQAVSKAALYPNELKIDGDDYINVNNNCIYQVKGKLPSGCGVNWSINSNDFNLQTLSYNTVLVSAKKSGVSAILTANVVSSSEKPLYTLTKRICVNE